MRNVWRSGFVCLLALVAAIGSHAGEDTIRVATYNLRNYLSMDRLVDGKFRRDYPKPEREKSVIRNAIREADPDLLAVQEIGGRAALLELRDDLAEEGVVFDQVYVLEADDDTRRIGALWNSAIQVKPRPHADLSFGFLEQRYSVKRGLLELEVEKDGFPSFSVFVLHLKSKYTTDRRDPQSNQRRIREAHAARERILERFPDPSVSPFLIVGDLNDYRNSSAVSRLLTRGDMDISKILEAKDANGLIWTHYYKKGGEYSLLDYMLASPGLAAAFRTDSSIVDWERYYEGSDHRVVWTDLQVAGSN